MTEVLRQLNTLGLQKFEDYVRTGAVGLPPLVLLRDPTTSEPVGINIALEKKVFKDRFEFGEYLVNLLAPIDARLISFDRGLWSALALFWFDQLCPQDAGGHRKVAEAYRYILSHDYKHYYRHLVRTPWQLVRDHGPRAKFMLLSAKEDPKPLRRHGEMVEQLGAIQSILRSPSIILLASRLYGNPATGRPKQGAAGKGAGSVRRLSAVLQQIDLTYDADALPTDRMLELLPKEFNGWKNAGS